jgi:hypothetical protein
MQLTGCRTCRVKIPMIPMMGDFPFAHLTYFLTLLGDGPRQKRE